MPADGEPTFGARASADIVLPPKPELPSPASEELRNYESLDRTMLSVIQIKYGSYMYIIDERKFSTILKFDI